MKNTRDTLSVEKKLVTLFDSLTPRRSKITDPNETKKAHVLIPKPGSIINMSNLYHWLFSAFPSQVLTYATTLSPQLLATADALFGHKIKMFLAIQIETKVMDAILPSGIFQS